MILYISNQTTCSAIPVKIKSYLISNNLEPADHKYIKGHKHIAYSSQKYSDEEMISRSNSFYHWLDRRRSVRDFSDRPIPKAVIENIIKTASTAPSGANKQPWTFCVVTNQDLKHQIRKAAEIEEKENYERRMSDSWKKDLEAMATDMNKSFLEIAPCLIVVFKRLFDYDEMHLKTSNYYVNESIGIACGMLISAIHNAGLVTLTHTPSPMNFLIKLLKRPDNEKPYLLLPVGFPSQPAYVPDIKRKALDDVSVFYE